MSSSTDLSVVFVCWGNICRSPMAERVAEKAAAEAGVTGVRFTSAGTSSEELGEPIDPRAARTLATAGYRTDGHRAHQLAADEARSADLVVAMEPLHARLIHRDAGDDVHVALLTDFDPDAERGSGVPDPWYGGQDGFDDTLAAVQAAMPGILDWIREHQDAHAG